MYFRCNSPQDDGEQFKIQINLIRSIKEICINCQTVNLSSFIMSPPCKGLETYCFSPCVCLSVCLSVTKSCPLYNLITVTDISTKLHTFVKHIETTCHAQEP